ncbi:hypothetical protein Tco_0594045 [Tanacetum coccineum]
MLACQPFLHGDVKSFADVGGGILGCRTLHLGLDILLKLFLSNQRARYDGDKTVFVAGAVPWRRHSQKESNCAGHLHLKHGDNVPGIKRCRRDLSSDDVMDLTKASGRFCIYSNANPPPTNNPHILPTALRVRVVQELSELQTISTYIDSRLESINRFLNGFTQQPNEIDVDDLEPDDESVDTPLVSPFLDSDGDPDDD